MKKFLLTISTISLLAPATLFAQIDTTMVNLPGMGGGATTFESYINTIYALTITIAAMLAVIKIVIAGVKYMTTDIVTTKGDAKKDIYGAIIGLLVVLAAVLIIEVINPDINDVTMAIETQVAPEVTVNIPTSQEICDASTTGCIIQECGRPNSVMTCEEAKSDCTNQPTMTQVIESGDNQIVCLTNADPTIVQNENNARQQVITDLMTEEGYSNLVETYSFDGIEISDRARYTNDVWPTQCEETASGDDTGNIFINEERSATDGARYTVNICVN